MVKVQDENSQTTNNTPVSSSNNNNARVNTTTPVAGTSNSTGTTTRPPMHKNRAHHHHLHHPQMQHFHHFHHHWSYPEPGVVVPPPGPATFHFGPGFEYQAQRPPGPGTIKTNNNSAVRSSPSSSPSDGAFSVVNGSTPSTSSSPQPQQTPEHVVHFHVNPGVTVSFQIGDSMELIQGKWYKFRIVNVSIRK